MVGIVNAVPRRLPSASQCTTIVHDDAIAKAIKAQGAFVGDILETMGACDGLTQDGDVVPRAYALFRKGHSLMSCQHDTTSESIKASQFGVRRLVIFTEEGGNDGILTAKSISLQRPEFERSTRSRNDAPLTLERRTGRRACIAHTTIPLAQVISRSR